VLWQKKQRGKDRSPVDDLRSPSLRLYEDVAANRPVNKEQLPVYREGSTPTFLKVLRFSAANEGRTRDM
jgi:hypothetical protein